MVNLRGVSVDRPKATLPSIACIKSEILSIDFIAHLVSSWSMEVDSYFLLWDLEMSDLSLHSPVTRIYLVHSFGLLICAPVFALSMAVAIPLKPLWFIAANTCLFSSTNTIFSRVNIFSILNFESLSLIVSLKEVKVTTIKASSILISGMPSYDFPYDICMILLRTNTSYLSYSYVNLGSLSFKSFSGFLTFNLCIFKSQDQWLFDFTTWYGSIYSWNGSL